MPQAIVDPEELRRFALNLKKFNHDVQERITVAGKPTGQLGQDLAPRRTRNSPRSFSSISRSSRFLEVIDRHVPYLMRKAEIIDEYLQQR